MSVQALEKSRESRAKRLDAARGSRLVSC
jgi:hypothetical protein